MYLGGGHVICRLTHHGGQQEIKHVTTKQKRNPGRNGIVSDGVVIVT